jgi:hypothetical protein
MELTRQMLDGLQIGERDHVVELAPGRGATTRMVLRLSPQSYTAVERDRASQQKVQEFLRNGELGRCVLGTAQATGLEDECASVVLGEAMLTMQTKAMKLQIAQEAFRLLEPGGRYGIHEACLMEDDLSAELKSEMEDDLKAALRVAAQPLPVTEWRELLEQAGFLVRHTVEGPMHLLEPRRMIQDEGLLGAVRFASRAIRSSTARRRILGVRRTFKKYSEYINAAALIAVRPE